MPMAILNATSRSEVILEAKNLTRKFTIDSREITALDGVDMTLYRGEIIGITGTSGAGKSTLLQLLGALDRPSSGHVFYEGKNIYKLNESQLAAFRSKSIGFVFQASNLLPEFSAEENVALSAMIAGSSKKEAGEKARKLLGQVGLSQRLSHRPGKLSGGEQQRVAIARSLVNEPSLVLTDEPTGNLDTGTGEEIMSLIFSLNRENGHTFVIVTHNLGLTKDLSRVLTLSDGRFVESGDDVIE
ncbi:Lipoprotein-releasing system ATP-binding protein LolD [hydrothermal vent metagenome]|uniref:Lipoprotein-releasing system ATP-binding protein LolD n=1 Tax=hydrothermal vent metagenome TaxID=652676 RepID=A0A3B1CK48_9ZZZZ